MEIWVRGRGRCDLSKTVKGWKPYREDLGLRPWPCKAVAMFHKWLKHGRNYSNSAQIRYMAWGTHTSICKNNGRRYTSMYKNNGRSNTECARMNMLHTIPYFFSDDCRRQLREPLIAYQPCQCPNSPSHCCVVLRK